MIYKIKEFTEKFTLVQIVLFLAAILSFLIFVFLTIWSVIQENELSDQQAAARWDEEGDSAQVSCFFAENVKVDEFVLRSFEKKLDQSLSEVLTQEETEEENGKRLWIDAYSSLGTITVISEKGKLEEVNAVGIGGDFFMFHPLQLLSGRYFSGNELMKDAIILDEDAAWQLFGSNDIAGMSVMIGGVPHYVSGVVKRPEGRFAKSAGLDKTVVYVSYETLSGYGKTDGINTYEVVAPNPVKHFVFNCVKEKIGFKENDMVVVENSSRYLPESLIPVMLDYGTRSMQNTAVRFPYWENIARGWEDVMALVGLFRAVFLGIPIAIVVVFLIKRWHKRKIHIKDIGGFLIDTKEKVILKAQREKNKWQDF